ncbi:MAG: hypothetical protein EAZ49_24065, partial [Oscillatoriales cyanobacterium]
SPNSSGLLQNFLVSQFLGSCFQLLSDRHIIFHPSFVGVGLESGDFVKIFNALPPNSISPDRPQEPMDEVKL